MKIYLTITLLTLLIISSFAETIKIVTKNGEEHELPHKEVKIQGTGLITSSGEMYDYQNISYIGTDDVKSYEKLLKKSGKKANEHLNVAFTGDKNLYAVQLEKLEKRRTGAHVARGAGGLLMIIGALSGDKSLYAAGAVTAVAGTVAKDINTEKTIAAQNDAIIALQEQQQAESQAEAQVEELRKEWGSENVDGLIALIDKNYDRALAFANIGETSSNENHQLGASWLKAMIYADKGDSESADKEYELLVKNDPEVDSLEGVQNWMKLLMQDLNDLRVA